MGKITGFMEFERQEEEYEAPAVRLKHWKEFVHELPEDKARIQAGRCMDCGIPFCSNGCPVNNIIPDFNDLVWQGDWQRALDVLHS
ncbi:MAG: glutamate synthase, partial [Thiomonas sp.]